MKRLLCLLILVTTTGICQGRQSLKRWYNKPSGRTGENALPIGNGRLGAMIYGNVEKETTQLTEQIVWSGNLNRNDNPLALDSPDALRRLIFDGKQKDAERLANRIIISKKSQCQKFEPVGSLQLTFNSHDNFSTYNCELDIERAVTKTSLPGGDVTYTREALDSFPDRVVVMRLTASKPGSISFTASFTAWQKRATSKTATPVISEKAKITPQASKQTFVYDIAT